MDALAVVEAFGAAHDVRARLCRAPDVVAHAQGANWQGVRLAPWDLLTPFAQYGQSLSLVFVASISLSLLFQSYECLRSIEGVIIYSSLVIIALTLFFMSIGRSTTHLRRHKRRSWPGCDETWPARAKLCVSARPVTQHGPCATDIVR